MIYSILRKILFQLDPETAHDVTLNALDWIEKLKLVSAFVKKIDQPVKVMGLTFPNPLGLAAGLDKNGEYIDALAALGFGFIEVGTITPKPQIGNEKPRLFRLEKEEALINRMGFNNHGVEYLVERLQKTKYKGILGINIGKNKDTPIEHAIDDYLYSFKHVAEFASYITINISSPNTDQLRQLQHGDLLKNLLQTLKHKQAQLNKYIPLVVKISPDLTLDELTAMAEIFLDQKIDGVIATNTTISRNGVEDSPFAQEMGGLSGKPLRAKSTQIIQQLHLLLKDQIPIIGCGGIFSKEDAAEKYQAGAQLLQIYSGFIYQGPNIINKILT